MCEKINQICIVRHNTEDLVSIQGHFSSIHFGTIHFGSIHFGTVQFRQLVPLVLVSTNSYFTYIMDIRFEQKLGQFGAKRNNLCYISKVSEFWIIE